MLRRVAERARAVVVHNPAAARTVREHAPAARVVEIPHLFQPPAPLPGEAEVARYRPRLGVEPGAFLFGVFGYLRESKRLPAVLEASRGLHRENPRTALLVAGEFVSTDLERAVRPLMAAAGVVRLPLSRRSASSGWRRPAVDACINLRYPAAGETSGIAIRLMGIGKPVLVTDSPECARFPEDACLRIAPGVAERESLRQHMILLTSMSEVARAIGQRGAGHIRAHHRVELSREPVLGLVVRVLHCALIAAWLRARSPRMDAQRSAAADRQANCTCRFPCATACACRPTSFCPPSTPASPPSWCARLMARAPTSRPITRPSWTTATR